MSGRPEPGTIMDDDQLEELAGAQADAERRTCATCRHHYSAVAPGPGECRHRSPRAVQDRGGAWHSQWPPVWPHDWCGAWREPEDDRA